MPSTPEEALLIAQVTNALSRAKHLFLPVDVIRGEHYELKKGVELPRVPNHYTAGFRSLLTKQNDPAEDGLWFEFETYQYRDDTDLDLGALIRSLQGGPATYIYVGEGTTHRRFMKV